MSETPSSGWPSPQDYYEAVQTPAASFADAELRRAKIQTNRLGLPWCMSGNFASVFCARCDGRTVAVRCFLRAVADQQKRYGAISRFVLSDEIPCTVPFEYLERGIKIRGDWFPLLKMQWVDGLTLGDFVSRNVKNNVAINLLATCFKSMTLDLRRYGIAHGDLQPDNIIISGDEMQLVDYDGMYVPALSGLNASELGHAEYQHPRRVATTFGPRLDNFSAWLIYTSLKALSRDPSLWQRYNCGADRLLFKRSDLEKPGNSPLFAELIAHNDPLVRNIANNLRRFLDVDPLSVPCLDAEIERAHSKGREFLLPQLIAGTAQIIGTARLITGTAQRVNDLAQNSGASVSAGQAGFPQWMRDDAETRELSVEAEHGRSDSSNTIESDNVGADRFSESIPPWLQSVVPENAPTGAGVLEDREKLRIQFGTHFLEAMQMLSESDEVKVHDRSNTKRDDLFPDFDKIQVTLSFTPWWFELQLIESGCLKPNEKIRKSIDITTPATGPGIAVVTTLRLIIARKEPYERYIKASSLPFAGMSMINRHRGELKILYEGSGPSDPGIIVSIPASTTAIDTLMSGLPETIPRNSALE